MPWVWTRRALANRWRITPWEVDEAPIDEILTELRLSNLEAEAQHAPRPGPSPAGPGVRRG